MMRFPRSSALTLAVAYIGLGLAALALFAAPLWYAWRVTVRDGRYELLQSDAQRLTEVFRRDGEPALVRYMDARVNLQIAGERLLLLVDPSMHPLAGNLHAWPTEIPSQSGAYTLYMPLGGPPEEVVLVHQVLPGGYHLLVGRDIARYVPLEQRFWYALGGAVVILSVFGTVGGILIRRALMARIHGIRRTVSAIIQGDLSHRLVTYRRGDELNTLSRIINQMLDQIEQLVQGVRNVSNAIAHDLRTPLAELRSRLEGLALTRPDTEETFSEIDEAVADVDRVIGIFNALLRLAEIDSGMRRSGFVTVDLGELVANAVEFYQPAAEMRDSQLRFESDGPASIQGDPVLLAQALSNLIDNALKYTPPDGTITVAVRRNSDRSVEIEVADRGPGIPDAEKPKVVERFYRGDTSRGTPGVGLGLSLVDAVARLHASELRLEDNRPGLKARIVLNPGNILPSRAIRPITETDERYQHEPVYP
ncbi:MAG TPA: ATP-binding protein [Steroidobacteraceae bacterium]|jgi:signal transduction histidine kinase|nr:ATP-binding protein [Steroidobacteraceae bacterium]